MRTFSKRISATIVAYSLVLLPAYSAQNQAVGAVLEAENAHIGSATATAGSSLFRGDLVSTESDGRAFVQVDSYLTPEQKEVFESWVLTAEFYDYPDGWTSLFKDAGYTGDYYWTIIE